jgi:hypothetical protein
MWSRTASRLFAAAWVSSKRWRSATPLQVGGDQFQPPGHVETPNHFERDKFRAANRRKWGERVAIRRRDATGFYAVGRFLACPLAKVDEAEILYFAQDSRAQLIAFLPSLIHCSHTCCAPRAR